MIRTAIVGLGKMGLSHLAILRAHPQLELVGACDNAKYLTDVLTKYTPVPCFTDLDQMLQETRPEAILIATPSRSHAALVTKALEANMHVFCEKPFVLDHEDGVKLVELAAARQRVTQVGYHYRFVGAFQEAARIVQSGALGDVHHVRAEAYGPVVLRPKGGTWRSSKQEGGGALYDYACHAIDLINFIVDTPNSVSGVVKNGVFSRDVDDEIYCTLGFPSGSSGQLCVNWSDESFRKMSTKVSVWGTNGRISADRQECQLYLREASARLPKYEKGWSIRYTTDLTMPTWYYLRGEEYSEQINYWANSITENRLDGENSFQSALNTDRVVALINGETSADTAPAAQSGILGRLMGRNRHG